MIAFIIIAFLQASIAFFCTLVALFHPAIASISEAILFHFYAIAFRQCAISRLRTAIAFRYRLIRMPENPVPTLDPTTLLPAIGDFTRWKILGELSRGSKLVSEIAPQIGHSPDNTSKHLAILRKAGAVFKGRGNFYEIPPAYLPSPGVIHYGLVSLHYPPPTP